MIYISQPALALHSCDVPGFRYQMTTTWLLPKGASAANVVYWISYSVDRSTELELKNVVINCHGSPGLLFVGGTTSPAVGTKDIGLFGALRTKDIGTLWLVSCMVATGGNGEQFCSLLAKTTGCDVVAANDTQFVERRYVRGNCPFGTIDDFEGAAYRFSPSGSKEVLSIHDPLAEPELYK
jgi:hypothetical protein